MSVITLTAAPTATVAPLLLGLSYFWSTPTTTPRVPTSSVKTIRYRACVLHSVIIDLLSFISCWIATNCWPFVGIHSDEAWPYREEVLKGRISIRQTKANTGD